jgi:hypothetical protein
MRSSLTTTRKPHYHLKLSLWKPQRILACIIGGYFVVELWLIQFSELSIVAKPSPADNAVISSQLAAASLLLNRSSSRRNIIASISHDVSKAAVVINRHTSITSSGDNQHQGTATSPLPQWIQDYVVWHHGIRQKFPGQAIFDDPNAPPLLIRTCLGLCGGLNDRIGQLPWDLYLANQTGRILLLHWHRPVPLENFLLPSSMLDWRVPTSVPAGFFPVPPEVRVSRTGMKAVRALPELFAGYDEAAPTNEFWTEHLDHAITRARTGAFRDHKVLRHRLLGHLDEHVLEERLRALGETDMIHNTETFGAIFRLFFQPSANVRVAIDQVYEQLNLRSHQFGAVHVRVRHPKATPQNVSVKGKNEDYTADKTGLPWEGATKAFAIAVASRAVLCAQKYFTASSFMTNDEMPLYFYSDSNDLVRYMVFEQQQRDDPSSPSRFGRKLVARQDYDTENAHIDKQKGRDPPAYYNTFVDLLVAADAQCIALGVGNFAVLASKISGTSCKVLYQKEVWGSHEMSHKFQGTPVCDLPDNVEASLKV